MSYNMSGSLGPKGKTYRWLTAEPFYRFGHGMAYTEFKYSGVTVNPEAYADPCQEVVIIPLWDEWLERFRYPLLFLLSP